MGALITDGTYLYGLTAEGGEESPYAADSSGVVFRIKIDGSDYEVLHRFDDDNGSTPLGSLLLFQGYLYGVTLSGGDNNAGVIFKLHPEGTEYEVLHQFSFTTGAIPMGALITDGDFFYGTTLYGGAGDGTWGVIYKIAIDGSAYTVLHEFLGDPDGGNSSSALILHDGWLYGTTQAGGNNGAGGDGTVFKIRPNGNDYEVIYSFVNATGAKPAMAPLITDGVYLYGTTPQEGLHDKGVIYRVRISDGAYEDLYHFEQQNGHSPLAGLIFYNNYLFGVTLDDGQGGVLFRVLPDGTNYTVLYTFAEPNGVAPIGTLLEHNGLFYGTTIMGGSSEEIGVIFRIGTDIILPLQLKSFTAFAQNCKAVIEWETTAEENVSHFEIETSVDGNTFKTVTQGAILARNSNHINSYKVYLDISERVPVFYRLKMIDMDGKFSYSRIASIQAPCESTISLFPNPAQNSLIVHTEMGLNESYAIYSLSGQIVLRGFLTINKQEIDISLLKSGTYIFKMKDESIKFIKGK